jgi:addiction module RelE/StbE family toxin
MQLAYSRSFLKDIKRLRDPQLLSRIEDMVEELKQYADFSEILKTMPIKKLAGSVGYYRLRLNNYRLGFFIDEDNKIILLRFGHRKDFYEGFP